MCGGGEGARESIFPVCPGGFGGDMGGHEGVACAGHTGDTHLLRFRRTAP